MATFDQLIAYTKKFSEKLDLSDLDQVTYDKYREMLLDEATAMDAYQSEVRKQSKIVTGGNWTFRGRALNQIALKDEVWVVIPTIGPPTPDFVNNNGWVNYQLTCTLKRQIIWYRRADVVIHDAVKYAKSGFFRIQGFDHNPEKFNLELARAVDVEASLDATSGLKVRHNQGSIVYPRMNRYMRNNMIMNMQLYDFRKLIIDEPNSRYALAAFGLFDVDDGIFRLNLSNHKARFAQNFLEACLRAYKDNNRDLYQKDFDVRVGILKERERYLKKASITKFADRLAAYMKQISQVNKILIAAYKTNTPQAGERQLQTMKSRMAELKILGQYDRVDVWSQVMQQVYVICVISGCPIAQESIHTKGYERSGVKYQGFTPGVGGKFMAGKNFEVYAPVTLSRQSSMSGNDFCQIMLNMVVKGAMDNPQGALNQAADDGTQWQQSFVALELPGDLGKFGQTRKAIIASIINVILELQETIGMLCVSYQSQNYKGISDSQFFTYICCMSYIAAEFTKMAGSYMFQISMMFDVYVSTGGNQVGTNQWDGTDAPKPGLFYKPNEETMGPYPEASSRLRIVFDPKYGADMMNDKGMFNVRVLAKTFMYTVEDLLRAPRSSKVSSASKFWNFFDTHSDNDTGLSGSFKILETKEEIFQRCKLRMLTSRPFLQSDSEFRTNTEYMNGVRPGDDDDVMLSSDDEGEDANMENYDPNAQAQAAGGSSLIKETDEERLAESAPYIYFRNNQAVRKTTKYTPQEITTQKMLNMHQRKELMNDRDDVTGNFQTNNEIKQMAQQVGFQFDPKTNNFFLMEIPRAKKQVKAFQKRALKQNRKIRGELKEADIRTDMNRYFQESADAQQQRMQQQFKTRPAGPVPDPPMQGEDDQIP